ncbi:Chymotrypsinogen B [Manis pentadactyla]|nr:Chymotrypsinogen B [Manis pentadactyla]
MGRLGQPWGSSKALTSSPKVYQLRSPLLPFPRKHSLRAPALPAKSKTKVLQEGDSSEIPEKTRDTPGE